MDFCDEKQLVEKAKTDRDAFGKLFDRYYEPILHYVLKRVESVQIAEDITSEVFFIIFKKLWQFQWRNIPFSAWLYRIANNEISYFYRKNKRKHLSLEALFQEHQWEPVDDCDLEEEIKQAEAEIQKHQDFLIIRNKLLMLPIKYQEVLSLKYLESKKIHEIAVILGKKENTVKSLLKRGLVMLQQKFQQEKIVQQISWGNISKDE